MNFRKWSLWTIFSINLLCWGMYLIGWQWWGFENFSQTSPKTNKAFAFVKYNFFQIIMIAVWILALFGLAGRRLPQILSLFAFAGMFGAMALVGWGEWRFDSEMGAERGALQFLIVSVMGLAINIGALCGILGGFDNFKKT